MPLYEYQCESCQHRFERIQKFSDPPIAVCPNCGGPVKKLFSSPAIQFKGSGFYITDYAKPGSASAADKSGGSEKAPSDAAGKSPAAEKTDSSGSGSAPSDQKAESKKPEPAKAAKTSTGDK
jgi:putative FmdB family regulatory protein